MDPGLMLLLQTIQNDVKDIKSDIKELQGFRWKVAGIATAASFIIGIVLKVMFH